MKRLIALAVLASVSAATLLGCTNSTPQPKTTGKAPVEVMNINSNSILSDEYAYYYNMAKMQAESMFGGEAVWDNAEFAAIIKPELTTQVATQLKYTYAVKALATENKITLDSEDEKELKDSKDKTIAQETVGTKAKFLELLKQSGATEALYDDMMETAILYEKLFEHYVGENGVKPVDTSAAKADFQKDYYRTKHILFSTQDVTGADGKAVPLTDAEKAAKKTLAEETLVKLQGGADFDTLMTELTEDPGSATNPDGYYFKAGDADPAFETASLALKDNEMSGLVPSSFGYHIILRLPLEDSYFEANLLENLKSTAFDAIVNEKATALTTTEAEALKDITFENFSEYMYK